MKVKELIEILSKLDQDTQIGFIDYEWDVGDEHGINFINKVEFVPKGWKDSNDGELKDYNIYKIQ